MLTEAFVPGTAYLQLGIRGRGTRPLVVGCRLKFCFASKAKRAHEADMPFGSCGASEECIRSAAKSFMDGARVQPQGASCTYMNRYQLEVAEMERRERVLRRAWSFAGAAVLIVAALWSAGLPPNMWFKAAQSWIARLGNEPSTQQSARPAPTVAPTVQAPIATGSGLSPSVLSGTDSSVSPTPQPLYLLSTSPGRNFQDGTAQIGTSTTNPQTYMAGALLANGAKLTEIHDDHVVLKRGDRTAKLTMFKLANNAAIEIANELLSVGGGPKPEPLVVTNREILTDYLRPSPVYDADLLRGYQVYPGRKAGIFAQLGLQAGDVITAINDVPFVDPAQAMRMFRQLTDGIAVVASIERKNKAERITLDGALIAADRERSDSAQAQQATISFQPPAT